MNKTIWMAWLQGEEDESLPPLNKTCIQRWRNLNPTWDVNILSEETISDYVPEYWDIIKSSPNAHWRRWGRRARSAHKTDLLRLLLLDKYGGVWADASLYPRLPLDDFWKEIMNETGFFAYRYLPRSYGPMGRRDTCVFFLCSDGPNNYLIRRWKENFTDAFRLPHKDKHNKGRGFIYFTMAQTLCDLYDSDPKVKDIMDNMVLLKHDPVHSALANWKERNLSSYMYKRPAFPAGDPRRSRPKKS